MKSNRRNALCALLISPCLAAASVFTGLVGTTAADDAPLASMLRLSSVEPAGYTTMLESARDTPLLQTASSEASEQVLTSSALTPDLQSLLERVEDLEATWQQHQAELVEKAADAKKKSSWKMSGRIHLDNWNFLNSDPGINYLESGDPNLDPQDRWVFRRIRLEIAGNVPHNMLFRTQIDFNRPSTPEMKDVYLGFDGLPHNQLLLIGNQKRPVGLDHLNSSRHNVFMERPLAVETFNEDARRLGICMYGSTDDASINWRYGAFLLSNIVTSGRYIGDFTQAGLYGRLAASPWYDEISGGRGYYHCAISASVNQTDPDGDVDADDNDNEARFRTRPEARSSSRWWNTNRIQGAKHYEVLGIESMLNLGSLQFTGEYYGAWVQRDPLGTFSGEDLSFHGGYIFASYFLTGEYIPLNRRAGTIDRVRPLENFFLVDRCCGGKGVGWGALAMALRFDYLDLSDSDIRGGRGWTCTAGMNWYWTAYSKVQANMIWGSVSNGGQGQEDPNVAFTPGVNGEFSIFGMRYMIDF